MLPKMYVLCSRLHIIKLWMILELIHHQTHIHTDFILFLEEESLNSIASVSLTMTDHARVHCDVAVRAN